MRRRLDPALTLLAITLVGLVLAPPAAAQQDVEEIGVSLVEVSGPLDPGRCAREVFAVWPNVPGATGYSVEYTDNHPEINRSDSRGAVPGQDDSTPERPVATPNRLLTGAYAPCEDVAVIPPVRIAPGVRFTDVRADVVLPGGRPTAVIASTTDFDRVTVDGSGSTPGPTGAAITRWEWHFGDGQTAEGPMPEPHRYDAAGTYPVTLVVTDADGRADVAVAEVTVQQALQVQAAGVTPSPASYTVDAVGQVSPVQIFSRWTVTNAGEEALEHIEVSLGATGEASDFTPPQLEGTPGRYRPGRITVFAPRGADPDGPSPFDLAAGQSVTVQVTGEGSGQAEIPVELTATTADGQAARASQVITIDGPDAVSWTVPKRTVLPEPGEPALQPADLDGYVNPATFPMDLAVSPLALCDQQVTFTVDGAPVTAIPAAPCDFQIELPREDDFELVMLVDGAPRRTLEVTIDDRLIAVVGDSMLSGEGNPDQRLDTDGVLQWLDDPCNRSYRSAGALAAAELEDADPQTSVTLAHMACSGASVAEGLLGPQTAESLTGARTLSYDQLSFLEGLVGDRRVDDLILGIGANDIQFGPLLYLCVTAEWACHFSPVSFQTYVTAESVLGINPVLANPFNPAALTAESARVEPDFDLAAIAIPQVVETVVTRLCTDVDAGATTVAVQEIGQADETFDLILNAREADLSGETPPGPGPTSATHEITARPTQQVVCDPAAGGGVTNGRAVPLASPVAQAHPAVYDAQGGSGVNVEPSSEIIGLQPRHTLAQTMAEQLIPQLRERYGALAARLRDVVDEPEDVLLVEYYDPAGDSLGGTCEEMLVVRPDIGSFRGLSIAGDEVRWARFGMLEQLNETGALAASVHDWTRVGGIAAAFGPHGYCAEDPWIVTLTDSWRSQGTPYGAVHPNAAGQEVMAGRLVTALEARAERAGSDRRADRRSDELSTIHQSPTGVAGVLASTVSPGTTVLELEAFTGDGGDGPGGISVGDVLQIDTFGSAEHRTVTATSPLTVDRPLERLHLRGSPVVVVDNLPSGPARDDEAYGSPAELASALPARTVLEADDTVATAIAWSRLAHPDDPQGGAPTGSSGRVLLGRADVFADSLAAGGGQLRGGMPLLLTGRDALDPRTLAELERLRVETVHILGGTAAVSRTVAVDLHERGFTVHRYGGATRVETAEAFASIAHPSTDEAVLARAFGEGTRGFADSLAAGTLAARLDAPVLLTATEELSSSTAAYLQRAGVQTVHLAGGTAAISQDVEDALVSAGVDVRRHGGVGRAETAVAIAEVVEDVRSVVVVDGGEESAWADGFAAVRWAVLHDAPVVLSQADGLPASTAVWLADRDVPITCGPSSAAVCP